MPNEANALRFALGMEAEPELLDIKPVALLTEGERRLFESRLAELETAVEADPPAKWWQFWRRIRGV